LIAVDAVLDWTCYSMQTSIRAGDMTLEQHRRHTFVSETLAHAVHVS